jgi:hypothetical protein
MAACMHVNEFHGEDKGDVEGDMGVRRFPSGVLTLIHSTEARERQRLEVVAASSSLGRR